MVGSKSFSGHAVLACVLGRESCFQSKRITGGVEVELAISQQFFDGVRTDSVVVGDLGARHSGALLLHGPQSTLYPVSSGRMVGVPGRCPLGNRLWRRRDRSWFSGREIVETPGRTECSRSTLEVANLIRGEEIVVQCGVQHDVQKLVIQSSDLSSAHPGCASDFCQLLGLLAHDLAVLEDVR